MKHFKIVRRCTTIVSQTCLTPSLNSGAGIMLGMLLHAQNGTRMPYGTLEHPCPPRHQARGSELDYVNTHCKRDQSPLVAGLRKRTGGKENLFPRGTEQNHSAERPAIHVICLHNFLTPCPCYMQSHRLRTIYNRYTPCRRSTIRGRPGSPWSLA